MRTAITSLLCLLLFASPETTWTWYPMNSVMEGGELVSGMLFYFENAPAPHASITVWGKRGNEPFEVSQIIDTDRVHGDTLFHFDIRDIDHFTVDKMNIKMGKLEQTKVKPHQGTYYEF